MDNTDFKRSYLMKKIDSWVSAVKKLACIAATQPHAAFATFTQCLQGQWTFLSRTMLDAADLFQPLEEFIRKDFIRALLKRDVNDIERDMLSLPARMGGLGLFKPTEECRVSSASSIIISAPLVRLIKRQTSELDPRELADEMRTLMVVIDSESEARFKAKREAILNMPRRSSSKPLLSLGERCVQLGDGEPFIRSRHSAAQARLRGSCDMRYGWTLLDLPISCACGNAFNVQHALDCKLGGLRIIQHNEVRDTIAQFMRGA